MADRRPPTPGTAGPHELLPWYLNGTLGDAEAEEFREHLQRCDACRSEMDFLRGLQSQIDEHGEVFLADHPSPDQLVAFARAELGDDAATHIRRHLGLCATCTTEVAWVRGEAVADGPALSTPAASAVATRRSWLPWAGALAAGLAGFLIAMPFRDAVPDPSAWPAPPVRMLPATERSEAGPTILALPPRQPSFLLVTEVDFPASAFPVRFEIRDAGGAVVRHGSIGADVPRDGLVFVDCARSDFPDGSYRLKLSPVGFPTTETAFRIQSD